MSQIKRFGDWQFSEINHNVVNVKIFRAGRLLKLVITLKMSTYLKTENLFEINKNVGNVIIFDDEVGQSVGNVKMFWRLTVYLK